MKVVLLGDEQTTDGPKRAGAVIEHPKAEKLIRLGKAVAYVEPKALPAAEPVADADEVEPVPDDPTEIEGEDGSGEATSPGEN